MKTGWMAAAIPFLVAGCCGRESGVEASKQAEQLRAAESEPAKAPADRPPEPAAEDGFSTPQKTFETLVRAVHARDLDLLKKCFTQEAQEGEAGLERAVEDPESFWAELQALLRGPQTLRIPEAGPEETRLKGKVEAPEAHRGGIGSIVFEKVGAEWKICTW